MRQEGVEGKGSDGRSLKGRGERVCEKVSMGGRDLLRPRDLP